MTPKFDKEDQFDYAIVGGGCMAVSAALALQREFRTAKIIIFEGSQTTTASKGIHRIIRTPYIDHEYVVLAEKAKTRWETEMPYRDFYRRTGWIQVIRGDNYSPFHSQERIIEAAELSCMVNSENLPQLDVEGKLWLNEDIGVADAALALEAVAVQAAVEGVIRRKTDISRILVESGVCCGVECIDRTSIRSSTTIVATGPWTPRLLESSNIQLPDNIQQNFFHVTAVSVAVLPLSEEEYVRFKSIPIITTSDGRFYLLYFSSLLNYCRRSIASRRCAKEYSDQQHKYLYNWSS